MKTVLFISKVGSRVEFRLESADKLIESIRASGGDDESVFCYADTVCEWHELVEEVSREVVGYSLEGFYDDEGRQMVQSIVGDNVVNEPHRVLVFRKQNCAWEHSGGPCLPVYGLKVRRTGEIVLALPEG
jgi:hypothetical protein